MPSLPFCFLEEAYPLLKTATLASGSSGNCTLVSDGRTHILIDAGISARRITTGLKALGIDPTELSAILITHEHSDHISGLATLKKQLDFKLCTTAPTARQLCYRMAGLEERIHTFEPGACFTVGSLEISSFPTSHDCACPVGYAVSDGGEAKLALATDLGMVTDAVREGIGGARMVIVESNYDPDSLRSGPYPPFLKERILGRCGHLSNEMGGELALHAVQQGARKVVLGHLSSENNSPGMAYNTTEHILSCGGVRVGADAELSVASRSVCSDWMDV